VAVARETVAGFLNGSLAAVSAVRVLAMEDRRRQWGETVADAARVVDSVLGSDAPPDWPDAPHLPGPPAPEPLPLDTLPPAVHAHVMSVADATQTPPDLALLISLAALSAAIRGRADVEVDARGWVELLVIYAAAILEAASRKSPVFAAMTDPLVEWERAELERVGPSYRRARDRADVAAAALAACKTAAAKGKADPDELHAARTDLEEAEAAVPILPRLLAADATPEALVRMMAEQGGALALLAPEADPLGIADGRYSDGGARQDELLRAWNGEAIRVDRVGRDSIHVGRPALTIGLTLQPAVLDGLRNARAMRGRGLLGRFLWCLPPHGLGTRRTGRDVPALDLVAAKRYDRLLHTLLDAGSAGSAGVNPHKLRLGEDALAVLYAFEAAVETDLADGGRLAPVRDWGGKLCGQAVRLAALLELAARAEDGRPLWSEPVGVWAMEGAVRLARALTSHALVVLAEMGMDRTTADARYVLRRAGEIPAGSTLRDLHDATRDRPGLEAMDGLNPVVAALVERGCLRLVERPREGPGRPPSPLVELHPALSGGTPETPPHNPHNRAETPEGVGLAGIAGANPGGARETEAPPGDVFESDGGDP